MKRFNAGVLLGAASILLIGAAWTAGWESLPQGSELASNLDTRIQEFKAEVRKRASVESIWGNSTNDNALARLGSARVFTGTAGPSDIDGPGQYDSAAGAYGGTALTTTELGGTADIGAGRLWIDEDGPDDVAGNLDDYQLNVWNETTNSWVPVSTRDFAAAGVGGDNIIYNGGFEVKDGFGGSGTPAQWALVGTPTLAYTDPPSSSEGEGIALRTTATGAGLEGIRQLLPSLKTQTTYVYTARARDVSAVIGGCTFKVSDGTTTSTIVTQGTSWETLQVQHTTKAAPVATVNVDLLSTNDTNACDWDEITVYEKNAPVQRSGIQTCFDTDNSTAAAYSTLGTWDDALVSCAITPPGPGYLLTVRGQLVGTHLSGNAASLAARIRENSTTTRSMGVAAVTGHTNSANHFEDIAVVPVFYEVVNPTPGTTLTFTLEGTPSNDTGPSWGRNVGADGTDDLDDSANLKTTLEVTMIPTR